MSQRPTWDETFLDIANTMASRSTCSRRKVGAVLVQDKRIISTGYNGATPGKPHCIDGGCPRGQLSYEDIEPGGQAALCGICRDHAGLKRLLDAAASPDSWVCPGHKGVPKDADYNLYPCVAVHAEANALLRAGHSSAKGGTLYVTHPPCLQCSNLIQAAEVKEVIVWQEP